MSAAAKAAIETLRAKGISASDILDVVEAILAASDDAVMACQAMKIASEMPQMTARQARNARYYLARQERLNASENRLKTSEQDAPLVPPLVSPKPPSELPPIIPRSSFQSEQRVRRAGLDGESQLLNLAVPETLITDWKRVRAAKRAGPITETVAAGLIREANLAGISPAEAIRIAVERGWQGFRARWLLQDAISRATGPPPTRTPTAAEQSRKLREAIERTENEQREREADRQAYPVLAIVAGVG